MSDIEYSIRNEDMLYLRPGQLCCIRCMLGGGNERVPHHLLLQQAVKKIQENSDIHICLHCAFDEVGARTELFEKTDETQRRFDLTVLQRLGLVPYSIRTARLLFELLNQRIPELGSLCQGVEGSKKWVPCPLGNGDFYQKGLTPIVKRDLTEKAKVKEESCKMIEDSDRIYVRIHHLLCITCFLSAEDKIAPLKEDNLYEVWIKMLNNPDIPVTLMEGCRHCMVCPPCHAFHMERGICDYGTDTAYEWRACGGGGDNAKRYQKGRAYAIRQLGFDL